MPTPRPDSETREEWLERCIPEVLDDGTAQDADQAVAVCSSMWEEATKGDKMNRAYAVLEVKAVEDDKRLITGVATTPSPDRVGDIIEPLGVKFKNPMPLLHQHRSDQPVGVVKFAKPTKDSITFEASLPNITEPGPLKDRVDTAWGEVKAGLVRGVSIGFKPMKDALEFMEDGGIRFLETEVLELSLVTIPANAEATIHTVKSIDAELLAASGQEQDGETSQDVKAATGNKPRVVRLNDPARDRAEPFVIRDIRPVRR